MPPMMSLVVQKSRGVDKARRGFASSQDFGRAKGSAPVWRLKAPSTVVKGLTSSAPSFQPLTTPKLRRGVKVASG